jgi:RHS repeat-associated protein
MILCIGSPGSLTQAQRWKATYNQAGDRLSKTAAGLATGTYLYTTGTHQLSSIGTSAQANDANGNTTGSVMGGNTYGFAYNGRNRLVLVQLNGVTAGTYSYNALGERIGKVAATTERFAYNEAGQLIGEFGTTNRDYIWVGTLPVAVIDNTISGSTVTSTVNYVTADQLGTPRAVSNSVGTVVWTWAYKGNPFGEQMPTSTAGYVLNLRFPGQYYDAESGTNYNLHRTYESAIGRYQQSDPMGLTAGMSTYGYVGSNPLDGFDPLGLIDLNLFPVNEDIHQYAQNIADQPGQYIVGGHGSPTSMYGPDGAALTPAEVAAQIEFDNNYSPGEPVTLVSCDTGAPASDGSPSFAEQLADDLGAPVTAPNSIAWLTPDGSYWSAGTYIPSTPYEVSQEALNSGPSILEPGQFVTYLPTVEL